ARRVHRLLPGAEPSDLVAVGPRGRERTPAEIVGQVGLEPVPNLFAKRLFLLAEVEVHGRLTVIISPRTAGPQPRDVLWLALPRHNLASDCRPQPRDVLRLALPHHTSAIDRSEEHTSEIQSRVDLLFCLLF